MPVEVKEPIMFEGWRCGECSKTYITKESATLCCQEKRCACGEIITQRYYTNCANCQSKADTAKKRERFANALKLTPAEYKGEMLFMEDDDHYFSEYGEMLERCAAMDQPPPPYLFACYSEGLSPISVEDLLENMLTDHYEDAYDQLDDVEGLEKFLTEWVAKQTMRTFYPNHDVAIITEPQDRTYDATIIIKSVDVKHGYDDWIHVIVPSWHPGEVFMVERHNFSHVVQDKLAPGVVLNAKVNIGALSAEDVRFYCCEVEVSEEMTK